MCASFTNRLVSVLALCCMFCSILAKEGHNVTKNNSTTICWQDGKTCQPETTCEKCCAGTSYTNKTIISKVSKTSSSRTVCGPDPQKSKCINDGDVCWGDDIQYECDKCCNGFLDDTVVCGVKCWKAGTTCTTDGSCQLCCDNHHVLKQDTNTTSTADDPYYECGCYPDGTKCLPGDTCYNCCNGAYDMGGWACGGTCLPDGTQCKRGTDCHLCCNREQFWYQTGQLHCGIEPCYPDGESCIPDVSCTNCCSGGAYNGDGTICGGSCLPKGTECTYGGTCRSCCQGYNWDEEKETGICEKDCIQDGIDCIIGNTCYSCCNGPYNKNGTQCGGTCIKNGKECDYYSTCNFCCESSKYDFKKKKHMCIKSDSETFYDT